MKFRASAIAASFALASSCASTPATRAPQSVPGIDSAVHRLSEIAAGDELSAASCVALLSGTGPLFRQIDPASFDWRAADKSMMKEQSGGWIRSLFEARIHLHSRISDLVQGSHDPCLREIRSFLVQARMSEELLTDSMEYFHLAPDQMDNAHERAFAGVFPSTLVNEEFGPLTFIPGDILLDRGDDFVSAQIARISDVENLFSHTAVIGEDKRGHLFVVETNEKDIVAAVPMKQYWKENPDVRMAIYRPRDAAAGHRAARFIYDYVAARPGQILYDYHMNDADPSEMFCSEVVQFAYRGGTHGAIVVPMYKSDLSRFDVMGKDNFIKRMGVPYEEVYMPHDIEVDPRFDLVADYRYSPILSQRRLDDAVASSLYDWMLNKGYVFPPELSDFAISDVAKLKAGIFGDKDVTKNMPTATIRAGLEFRRVFNLLQANLAPIEKAHYRRTGHPMPFQEMLEANENFRRSDCAEWRKMGLGFRGLHATMRSKSACFRN
ncbi:MAG: YiiX/YebB-like N1pC/P60 family cysteine hydrolase [Bdellovibrionota bacterium]